MLDIEIIDDPDTASVALDPVRNQMLAELGEPASASTLAERVGITRQKANYHLNILEAHGLLEVAEERIWGGLREHLMVATAKAYLVSPDAMGKVAVSPERQQDQLSPAYLVALAARVIREVGRLLRQSRKASKPAATYSIDAEIRFRSDAERAKFTKELTKAVNSLVARYHDESSRDGLRQRLVVLEHPLSSRK